ncbi:MAG: putative bifunctional diguanylate cyclase/phosphodiesterase [Beijerinckiaceae bacterium]
MHGTNTPSDGMRNGLGYRLAKAKQAILPTGGENPAIFMSQFGAYAELMPLLYFILISNLALTAWNFYGIAPDWATILIPLAACVICVVRGIFWLRLRGAEVSLERAKRLIEQTSTMAVILAITLTAWSVFLFHYGTPLHQGQIAFFVSTTTIGCILCQISVRPAAIKVLILVNLPFSFFLIWTGTPTFVAIGVNLLLVSGGIWQVIHKYNDYLRGLVDARAHLREKNAELNRIAVEAERLLRENLAMSNIDSLTGLANRRQFFSSLNDQIKWARHSSQRLAVGVIDLDGFKAVNDLYGHACGDELLRQAAQRLMDIKTEHTLFARLGGDEFAFILKGWADDAALMNYVSRICETLRIEFDLKDCVARVSGSTGIAMYPDASDTPAQLYEKADYALYHAKRTSRGNVVTYNDKHEGEIRRRRSIEQALRGANFETDMDVMFQPIFDADTMLVLSFESLARWDHPELGRISPAEFIPIAEQLGLIGQLTRSLLGKSLNFAKTWPEEYRVAFNLSPLDVTSPEAAIRIVAIAAASGINPRQVRFEITESAVISNIDDAKAAISLFKQFGARVAIDDFGTGYSSLSHLHRLPWDYIKIDKSFIADITTNSISEKLVKSIVSMTRELNLRCVAEGIENPEQLAKVISLGIPLLQGYHLSRPLDYEAVQQLIARQEIPRQPVYN